MVFKILLHTFRMVFGNFGQALKISVGPYLILLVVLFGLLFVAGETIGPNGLPSTGSTIILLLIIPLSLFVTAWVAVSWHRFILKEEYASILPAVSGRPIWPYAGKAILLSLLVFLVSIPILVITMAFLAPI